VTEEGAPGRRNNDLAVDALLAGATFCLLALMTPAYTGDQGQGTRAGLLITLAMSLGIVWRRCQPAACAAVVFAAAFVQWMLSLQIEQLLILPADFLVLVAIYNATGYASRRTGQLALATGGLGALLDGVGARVTAPGPPRTARRSARAGTAAGDRA
jgi:hypothetical protein